MINFRCKKCDFFCNFCLKHRFWVHVRTAVLTRPTIYVLEQKEETNNTLYYIYKWGVWVCKSQGHVIMMQADLEGCIGKEADFNRRS